MKKWQNYSLEQLREAIASSSTIKEVLGKIGVKSTGGYKTIYKYAKDYDIDISHFKRLRGKPNTPAKINREVEEAFFLQVVSESINNRQVIRLLGWFPVDSSANRRVLQELYKKYKPNKSHFKGASWNKGKTYPEKRKTIDEYLVKGKKTSSHGLRVKLLEQGIFPPECSCCKSFEWQNKPIKLTLDHINGDRTDNTLENLRILCGNCHAQTPTYKGKNQKRGIRKKETLTVSDELEKVVTQHQVPKFCVDCLTTISYRAERCKSCVSKIKAAKNPGPLFKYPAEWLKEQLKIMPRTTLATHLKCSDNAIKKKIERYEKQQKRD